MEDIQPTDLPLSIVEDKENEWMSYLVVNVHGNPHRRFVSKEEAELYIKDANAGLSKEPARDTGAEPAPREPVKQKEKPMPRGIPKKKAKKAKKRAAVVKKSSKKVLDKGVKKAKKRKKARSY